MLRRDDYQATRQQGAQSLPKLELPQIKAFETGLSIDNTFIPYQVTEEGSKFVVTMLDYGTSDIVPEAIEAVRKVAMECMKEPLLVPETMTPIKWECRYDVNPLLGLPRLTIINTATKGDEKYIIVGVIQVTPTGVLLGYSQLKKNMENTETVNEALSEETQEETEESPETPAEQLQSTPTEEKQGVTQETEEQKTEEETKEEKEEEESEKEEKPKQD